MLFRSEPEEEEETKQVNETTWNTDAPWTNSAAKDIFEFLKPKHENIEVRYTQSYVSITIDNRNAYWLYKRMKPASALMFSVKDEEKAELIKKIFEENKVDYTYNRYKEFMVYVDTKTIKGKQSLFEKIHSIRFKLTIEDE